MFKRPAYTARYFDDLVCPSETADATGSHNLTQTGNVPYGNQGQPIGGSASGIFSGANYMSQAASLNTVMFASPNSWAFQFYVKRAAGAGTEMVMSYEQAAGHCSIHFAAGDKLTFNWNGSSFASNAVVADGNWNLCRYEWNGTNTLFYLAGALDTTSAVNGAWLNAVNPIRLGIYHDGVNFPLQGYLNAVQFEAPRGGNQNNRNVGFSR